MTTLFPIEPIRFKTAPPQSKKNSPKVITLPVYKGGRRVLDRTGVPVVRASVQPNDVALAQERELRGYLEFELGGDGPVFGHNDVKITVDYHARSDELVVTVEDLGPKPNGFTGRKRDMPNFLDVVLDAMQGTVDKVNGGRRPGPVYWNDSQVAELTMRRLLT